MAIFMDRHEIKGTTASEIAELHRSDLAIEQIHGVRFLTYWFDDVRGTAFCLINAPDAETAMRAHDEAHGNVAARVIEVDLSAVEAFLGRVSDRTGDGRYLAGTPALRTVMFTDIVDSTRLGERLGDARMVEMIRAHDGLVRRALGEFGGREIKHTGDGLMASFEDVRRAAGCACAIQREFHGFNVESREKLHVRIGLDAGEPVEDEHDLFGATVQMAARLCQDAASGTVVVAANVRALLDDSFSARERGSRNLKGFSDPVQVFEILWR